MQIAPAVRVSIGEEFGYKVGSNVIGKLISALRLIGADYVFDTTFGADLTVMEEAYELVNRIKIKITCQCLLVVVPLGLNLLKCFILNI